MKMTANVNRAALFGLLTLASFSSHAHSFGAGTDAFQAFVEGARVMLFEPITLFAGLSAGLMITLWRSGGMLVAWPPLIVATLVGFLAATLAPDWAKMALIVVGTLTATLAAVLQSHKQAAVMLLVVLTGVLSLFVALEGHTWMELSAAIYVGLILGAQFSVVIGAALAQMLLEKFGTAAWSRIAIRVAASWLAAMQILILAFQFV